MSNHCSSLDGAAPEWSQRAGLVLSFLEVDIIRAVETNRSVAKKQRFVYHGAPLRGLAPGGKGVLQEFGMDSDNGGCRIGLSQKILLRNWFRFGECLVRARVLNGRSITNFEQINSFEPKCKKS